MNNSLLMSRWTMKLLVLNDRTLDGTDVMDLGTES